MSNVFAPVAPAGRRQGEVEEHLVGLLAPASFEAEQYRTLRQALEQLLRIRTVIAVTSPGDGDGKTTTAINLAVTLAQAPELRVLLADLDLRGPSVGGRLGLDDSTASGVADAIVDPEVRLEDVVRPLSPLSLSVLPAGRCPAVPYELLKSPRLGALLDQARQQYDYIVVDTPPLVALPDCQLIGRWVDGFLLVVAAHRTPRELLAEALEVDPGKLIGVVFNRDDRLLSQYYAYAYAYHGSQAHLGWWARMGSGLGGGPRPRPSSSSGRGAPRNP